MRAFVGVRQSSFCLVYYLPLHDFYSWSQVELRLSFVLKKWVVELVQLGILIIVQHGIHGVPLVIHGTRREDGEPSLGVQQGIIGGEPQEIGGERPAAGGERPVVGGKRPKIGGEPPEIGGKRPLTGGDQPKRGGRRPPTGGDQHKRGGRRPLTGGKLPKTGGGKENKMSYCDVVYTLMIILDDFAVFCHFLWLECFFFFLIMAFFIIVVNYLMLYVVVKLLNTFSLLTVFYGIYIFKKHHERTKIRQQNRFTNDNNNLKM